MNFEEAKKLSLEVEWKTTPCNSGEKCWCRIIEPVVPILYDDEIEEIYIVHSGSISEEYAEHIVKLHNEFVKSEKNKISIAISQDINEQLEEKSINKSKLVNS